MINKFVSSTPSKIGFAIGLIVGKLVITPLILMLCWHVAIVPIFHLSQITFIHAIAFTIIINIITASNIKINGNKNV